MNITWHGHSCFEIETRQGTRLLVDPFLDHGMTRKGARDFNPDLILLTHGHDDHVGSTLDIDAPVLGNFEIATHLQRQGASRTTGMNIGGFYKGLQGVRIWMAPALHSSGFHTEDGPLAYGGNPCGFLVDDGETRFYHSGDTGLFGDMRTVIRDVMRPDVAAIPIGDLFTMGPEHAALAAEWLGVGAAIPMHFNPAPDSAWARRYQESRGQAPPPYFPPITVDPDAFVREAEGRVRVVAPLPDETLTARGRSLEPVAPRHV